MRGRTIAGVLMAMAILTMPTTARAEARPVNITGYCLKGITASGAETHEGICAYRREDIGKIARVYDAEMNLIGEYEIADTGKKGGKVRKGETVDIWKATKEECYQTTQQGFIEIVEREATE